MRHQTTGTIAICVVTIVMAGLGIATPASAQQRYTISTDVACDPVVGEWDVTVMLTDAAGEPFFISGMYYSYDTQSGHFGPFLDADAFDPASVPPGGSTSVTIGTPGVPMDVEVAWAVRDNGEDETGEDDSVTIHIESECHGIQPTTSIVVGDPGPETTTTAEVAFVSTPRYAG